MQQSAKVPSTQPNHYSSVVRACNQIFQVTFYLCVSLIEDTSIRWDGIRYTLGTGVTTSLEIILRPQTHTVQHLGLNVWAVIQSPRISKAS